MSNPQISLDQLRDVVLGRDARIPRVEAIALLRTSDFSDKEQLFAEVLENEHEPAAIRSAAAMSLGRIMTLRAEEMLIKNSQIADQGVLADVVKALGRIGDRSALVVLEKVKQNAIGLAAEQARFAAALISHRLGVAGNDLPVPTSEDLLALPGNTILAIQVTRANASEAEESLHSLAMEPFGIDFAKDFTYQVRCGRSTRMIMLNRDFTDSDAIKKLIERKAFLGVVATRFEESDMYSPSFLLLTSPVKQSSMINILIHRTTGALAFSGTAQVEGDLATFSIRTISQPGANPVQIEGTFTDGKLNITTALSATFRQKRRQPEQRLAA